MRALTWAQYERLSAAGSLVPVFREVPADLLTPVSAFLALSAGHSRPFLLESVEGGEQWGRYLDTVSEDELSVIIPFPEPAVPRASRPA